MCVQKDSLQGRHGMSPVSHVALALSTMWKEATAALALLARSALLSGVHSAQRHVWLAKICLETSFSLGRATTNVLNAPHTRTRKGTRTASTIQTANVVRVQGVDSCLCVVFAHSYLSECAYTSEHACANTHMQTLASGGLMDSKDSRAFLAQKELYVKAVPRCYSPTPKQDTG